jgi:hypothetical protein
MRVAIVNDQEFQQLVNRLEFRKLKATQEATSPQEAQRIDDVHRRFHYEVMTWIDEVGGVAKL